MYLISAPCNYRQHSHLIIEYRPQITPRNSLYRLIIIKLCVISWVAPWMLYIVVRVVPLWGHLQLVWRCLFTWFVYVDCWLLHIFSGGEHQCALCVCDVLGWQLGLLIHYCHYKLEASWRCLHIISFIEVYKNKQLYNLFL